MMQQKISSGAAMRKTRLEGVAMRLPSGWVVAIRNVPIAALMVKGWFSDPLTSVVHEILGGDERKLNKISTDRLIEGQAAMEDLVCRLAVVNPRIVDTPQADDEISIDDLSTNDKRAIFNVIYKPAEVLARESFREEQTKPLEPLAEGQAVQTSSERPD